MGAAPGLRRQLVQRTRYRLRLIRKRCHALAELIERDRGHVRRMQNQVGPGDRKNSVRTQSNVSRLTGQRATTHQGNTRRLR